ncbi:hypothetical protein FA13DRAFT_1754582 [Coprinellus micaceus]|uniref:GH16 domain-containing protein n=1 Tax=Coprinellus micaceus TaxID=71717 RepID=A0A4Y7TDC4_COPMI|nr:hypothetical protein FA13DRAFT_1754582 [Coprinellus micaceus]
MKEQPSSTGWAYYGNVDNTTWGNVTYQDRASAASKRLTYVNDARHAIVKVDNATTLTRERGRGESRLYSYGMGSLIVMDALHIPYGCSVWPAFWTYGIQEEWPRAGEIDIIEAINGMDHNQIALHTTQGCFKGDTAAQSGQTLETDCSLPRGCIVRESKTGSFGRGFADAGGGVYALLMEATAISIWFFSRPDVPENLGSATPSSSIDVGTWGPPTAAYPPGRCDLENYFPPQNLVLLTTLCGVWAGVPSIYRSTCPGGTGSCFDDNVIGPGNKFDTAYWEIRYVRAYMNDQFSITTTSGGTGEPSQTTTSLAGPHAFAWTL